MKKINIIYLFLLGIFFASCEPVDMTTPDLGSKPTGDFTITNVDDYHVNFVASSTDGFIYNWDLGNGVKTQGSSVSGYFPFKATYNVVCTISGKAGTTEVVKTITVNQADPALTNKPNIKELTGAGAGQTWVYATDQPDGQGYCYMVASYDWTEFWWDPYEEEASPNADGEMSFNLDGGFNFIGVDGNKGSFILGDDDGQLTVQFVGANILDWNEENCNPDMTKTGKYNITVLNDNELVLVQHQFDDDYAWTWRFKRKGYSYPTK